MKYEIQADSETAQFLHQNFCARLEDRPDGKFVATDPLRTPTGLFTSRRKALEEALRVACLAAGQTRRTVPTIWVEVNYEA